MSNATGQETRVRVENNVEFQGVTLWLGDGAPCTVEDGSSAIDVLDWITAPLQRHAMAARLRLIAEWLDNPAFNKLQTRSTEAAR